MRCSDSMEYQNGWDKRSFCYWIPDIAKWQNNSLLITVISLSIDQDRDFNSQRTNTNIHIRHTHITGSMNYNFLLPNEVWYYQNKCKAIHFNNILYYYFIMFETASDQSADVVPCATEWCSCFLPVSVGMLSWNDLLVTRGSRLLNRSVTDTGKQNIQLFKDLLLGHLLKLIGIHQDISAKGAFTHSRIATRIIPDLNPWCSGAQHHGHGLFTEVRILKIL